MKKEVSLLMLACLGCSMNSFAQVSNDNEDEVYKVDRHAHHEFRQGEVIVKFKADGAVRKMAPGKFKSTAVGSVDRLFAVLGIEEVEPLMPLTGKLPANAPRHIKSYSGHTIKLQDLSQLYTLRFKMEEQTSVYDVVEKLQALDEVEFAEPNYIVYLADATEVQETLEVEAVDDIAEVTESIESVDINTIWPGEPLVNQLWGVEAINLPLLWMQQKNSDKRPVIAILDTGVDIMHPDLAANIWTNTRENEGSENADDDANGFKDDIHGWDFVNNSPRIRDNNGHGTHCAGIAGAVGGNGIGIVGANPDALIMPVTVMQSDGSGDVATIIKGIDYAAANGADVISMSFGGYSASTAQEQALGRAYSSAILVAAAGNDGYCMNHAACNPTVRQPMPMFPAAYNFVLGVQASEHAGHMAVFSNYDDDGGFYSSHGESKLYNYELQAPGANILSAFPGGKYKTLNGTSMACPLVAGALSRLIQSKDVSNKEELFGDLINSKTSAGNVDIYQVYKMSDKDRKPSLSLVTYNLDDTAGDGDGRVDAGETIDIYPVLRNAWGTAKNIRVSIELAETEDPNIVEIIDDTVDFGYTLNSYAQNPSMNPLRIKINDECADGRNICLIIKATCDNAVEMLEQTIVLKAENGVEIGGVLSENMTMHAGRNYIVTQLLAVPQNLTLTIEPGAIIVFKEGSGLKCEGTINAKGQPNNTILFTCSPNEKISYFYIASKNVIQYVVLKDLIFNGKGGSGIEGGAKYSNCIIDNVKVSYPLSQVYLDRTNVINLNNGAWFQANAKSGVFYTYVNMLNNYQERTYGLEHDPDVVNFEGSNIFSNIYGSYIMSLPFTCSSIKSYTQDKPNYYGSNKTSIVHHNIIDFNNPILPNKFGSLQNWLSRPSSEAHGIVWKVVVNGKDAQDEFEELAPLGVGKHKFEVYFNRPMNKEVTPFISMGVREPYTQTVIAEDGSWNEEGDIYTAYLTITGKSNFDGLNRIYVADAQDDEYFEIPEEKYRFNVMVQKAGSMATGLMAEAGLGKVNLTWETDEEDFADMMGYNVYRYTVNDKGEQSAEKKLNENLVDSDETTYTDFDVVPGTTYYYIVKEMGTDLQEHIVSNAVAATPLTAQKGDANGSMTVDVADVVTEVNYLTNQNPQPFIFEAADVNSDNAVNILDVVGTVNLIFRPDAVGTESVENTATYFVNDGILYVDTPTPLGGAQVSIAAPQGTEFEALEGLNGMEQASFWQNDNAYMLLAYSMSGKYIPMGVQPLLRVGDAEVTDMVLSDTRGHNVLAINDAVTSINALPFGFENYAGAEVRYYDLTGRAISRTQAQQQGVHIQSIFVGGKCMKSYKVLK